MTDFSILPHLIIGFFLLCIVYAVFWVWKFKGKIPYQRDKAMSCFRFTSNGAQLEIIDCGLDVDCWSMIYDLNKLLKKETFFPRPNRNNVVGYVFLKNEAPIGYCTWNFLSRSIEKPVLRQIYIIPAERGKGYATLIFAESKRLFNSSPNVYIDSPTKETAQLLRKLGYSESNKNVRFLRLPFILRFFGSIFNFLWETGMRFVQILKRKARR